MIEGDQRPAQPQSAGAPHGVACSLPSQRAVSLGDLTTCRSSQASLYFPGLRPAASRDAARRRRSQGRSTRHRPPRRCDGNIQLVEAGPLSWSTDAAEYVINRLHRRNSASTNRATVRNSPAGVMIVCPATLREGQHAPYHLRFGRCESARGRLGDLEPLRCGPCHGLRHRNTGQKPQHGFGGALSCRHRAERFAAVPSAIMT